jgi:hypothetical protein
MPRTTRQLRRIFFIAIFTLTQPLSTLAAPKASPSVQTQVKKIGKNRKVNVTLTDGTIHEGTLKDFDDSSFSLEEGKNKGASNFSYTDVISVKPRPATTKEKVLGGVGLTVLVGAGVLAVVAILHPAFH